MKQDFKECPDTIDEGRLFGFKSWQEHVAAVSGYKSNGWEEDEIESAGLLYNIRSRSDIETGAKTGPEAGVITSLGPYENLLE